MGKVLLKYIPAFLTLAVLAIVFGTSQKSKDDLVYNQNMDWKLNSGEKDLLVLGDSRVMFSSHPNFIESSLDGLNFAFPTNSFTKFYLDLVRNKINASSTILIGISLESLSGRSENAAIKSFLSKFGKRNRLLTTLGIYVNTMFPSFDFKLLIQKKNPFHDFIKHQPRNLQAYPNGWSEYRGDVIDESRLVWHYEKGFKQLPPKYEIAYELYKFVGEMNKKGHKIYFFESPMSKEILAAERKGYPKRDQYLGALYARLKKLGACHIQVSGPFKTYDGDHMLPDEAKRFSKILGEKIKNNDCEK